jgi:predicted HTH transcriptional regulator
MAGRQVLFVSSVQKELAKERAAIRDYVHGNSLLSMFFEVFLFEDLPAADRKPDEMYLNEVDRCSVYVGIFGNQYGVENKQGISPTEREFDLATDKCKYRIVFVKGSDDSARHAKINNLIGKAGSQVVRRRFTDTSDLTTQLYDALIKYLNDTGKLMNLPFDESECPGALLTDISAEMISWFLPKAREERKFSLNPGTPKESVLEHLHLLSGALPTYSAILLFGEDPQKFLPQAKVKCLHFHGMDIEKPVPSYQTYTGTVFEQADRAVDFVMSALNRRVAPRDKGPISDTGYEIPKPAVSEAIINAVAHRDYTSNASVQVMVFADRVEVWNPGCLPPDLTPERLREEHPSLPKNPRIADPLYLVHYIEEAGTGTLDMIGFCRKAELPEPDFEQRGTQFVVTLWRDWLTDDIMRELGITDRQKTAIRVVKDSGRVSSTDYSNLAHISRQTAFRDLNDLVCKGILEKKGVTGVGTYYTLCKGLRKVTYDSKNGET